MFEDESIDFLGGIGFLNEDIIGRRRTDDEEESFAERKYVVLIIYDMMMSGSKASV